MTYRSMASQLGCGPALRIRFYGKQLNAQGAPTDAWVRCRLRRAKPPFAWIFTEIGWCYDDLVTSLADRREQDGSASALRGRIL